ncbi:MAG TPA: efflux transporter outer membrane subunit [Dyella sp.]|uniref:efflux transporter outer membrane subunit n=1 Tax=Dyella sp. TaxID=1869338 RepID=UPI002F932431
MSRPVDRVRRLLPLALLLGLSGCSLAPTYHQPSVGALPDAYAGAAHPDGWTTADPADTASRGDWWKVYADPALDRLENQLNANNPNIAVALARYEASRAFEQQLHASQLPQAGVLASPTNDRQSNNRPLRGANQPNEYDTQTLEFAAGYELDLWGRIRNAVAAGTAESDASAADLASARLSLQAQLADLYIRLRGYDVQARIVQDSLDAYGQGRDMTRQRMEGGVSSGLDVARADAQFADAQAQASELRAQRALTVHAIAALVGVPASGFSVPPSPSAMTVPAIPLGVPSTLLQRRPDIAGAERRTFAANANIGVARAAFFPTLSLSAAIGWQDVGQGNLLAAGNRFWALGPLASLSLFDGGLRRARVAQARAELDAASGQYRAVVLSAFQQVEDNLSLLQELGREAMQEDAAAAAANESQTLATNRYKEGVVSYLDVVSAQTTALQAERTAELVRTRRLQASVDLIRALGGGWEASAKDTQITKR